jgi:hypothetical protein
MKTLSILKRLDMFGFKFQMYFNKSDEPHTTWPGAIVSVILYGFIIWQSYIKLESMFTYSNDSFD